MDPITGVPEGTAAFAEGENKIGNKEKTKIPTKDFDSRKRSKFNF